MPLLWRISTEECRHARRRRDPEPGPVPYSVGHRGKADEPCLASTSDRRLKMHAPSRWSTPDRL